MSCTFFLQANTAQSWRFWHRYRTWCRGIWSPIQLINYDFVEAFLFCIIYGEKQFSIFVLVCLLKVNTYFYMPKLTETFQRGRHQFVYLQTVMYTVSSNQYNNFSFAQYILLACGAQNSWCKYNCSAIITIHLSNHFSRGILPS